MITSYFCAQGKVQNRLALVLIFLLYLVAIRNMYTNVCKRVCPPGHLPNKLRLLREDEDLHNEALYQDNSLKKWSVKPI